MRRPGIRISLLACGLLALLAVALPQGAGARTTHSRHAHLARISSRASLPLFTAVDGKLAATTPLALTVELTPRNAAALAEEATSVSTPGSSDFRHYLTVSQFADRYGQTEAAVTAVRNDLEAAGLGVSSASANNLFLSVHGEAGAVDRALDTVESQVTLDTGRVAYANTQSIRLPSTISGYVSGVIGLDDLHPSDDVKPVLSHGKSALSSEVHPGTRGSKRVAHLADGGPQPCAAAAAINASSSDAQGYTYDELATAYGVSGLYGAGDEGAGQTIGILGAGSYSSTDASTFFACYGISPTVNNVAVDGGPGTFNPNTGDEGEAILDLETVGAIAPKATIDVYQSSEADSETQGWIPELNAAVSANQAKVISSSLAECEANIPASQRTSDTTLLQEAATQGQSFFVASGDSGAESCSQLGKGNLELSVMEPDAQPDATAVGGTTLYQVDGQNADFYTGGSNPAVESVWNEGPNPECDCSNSTNGGGSGGGLSTQFAMPAYQSSASSSLDVINSGSPGQSVCGTQNCREVPDISADADSDTGYILYGSPGAGDASQWEGGVGGTSASAPLWAGIAALIDADGACRGIPIGFVNPALYQLGGTAYAANFNDPDMTNPISGAASNDTLDQFGVGTDDPNNLYSSITPGYTMSTGIGTPIASALANSLCAITAPVYTVGVNNPGTQTSNTGSSVSVQIGGSDSGNASLNYSASSLPAGLSISGSGLVTGTPTTAGSSSVTITARDQYSNTGSTTFVWNVNTPPPPTTTTTTTTPTTTSTKNVAPKVKESQTGAEVTDTITAAGNPVKKAAFSTSTGVSFQNYSKKTLVKYVQFYVGTSKLSYTITRVSASHGQISLTLAKSETTLTLKFNTADLRLTKAEKAYIKKHKVKSITVALTLTTANGKTYSYKIAVKI